MHRAIIFDLGKVLLHFDFGRGFRALAERCPHAACDIPARIGAGLVERFEMGRIGPREFFAEFSRQIELSAGYDEFCEIWNGIFTETLIPEAMLEGLASRYRLLLLSNTNAIHFEMIRRTYPMLRHFHDLVLSYEFGAAKPHAEIFRETVRRAGCRPEECFYTDDVPKFVEAARTLGIDAVQFRSCDQLEQELTARRITWA
jgi:glucose-1-phosphatase